MSKVLPGSSKQYWADDRAVTNSTIVFKELVIGGLAFEALARASARNVRLLAMEIARSDASFAHVSGAYTAGLAMGSIYRVDPSSISRNGCANGPVKRNRLLWPHRAVGRDRGQWGVWT